MIRVKHGETMYVKCLLEKEVEGGLATTQSWIREKIAVVGNVLDNLHDVQGDRVEHGWKVVSAGGTPRPESFLVKNSHDSRKLAKVSDV